MRTALSRSPADKGGRRLQRGKEKITPCTEKILFEPPGKKRKGKPEQKVEKKGFIGV